MPDFVTTRERLAPLHRLLTGLEADALRQCFSATHPKVLVDIASGTGRNLPTLLRVADHVYAVEPEAEYIARAKERLPTELQGRVTWIEAMGSDFDVPEPVDAVVVSGLFILLTDEQVRSVVRKAAEVLRPGGQLYVREAVSPLFTWERHGNESLPWAIYRPRPVLDELVTDSGLFVHERFDYLRTTPVLGRYAERIANRLHVPSWFAEKAIDAATSVQVAIVQREHEQAASIAHEKWLLRRSSTYAFCYSEFRRSERSPGTVDR